MIAIIDYGAGNLQSVAKAFHFLGCPVTVTRDKDELSSADAAVLPGVGAFGHAMDCLEKSGMVQPTLDFIGSGKPFLGICLGLQLLFQESEETPGVAGLGVLPGKILRFPENSGLKIPQIGWNSLSLKKKDGLFQNLDENPYVYFVHSYYLQAARAQDVSACADYAVTFDAAVQKGNVHATQFHPEKSGKTGLQMLRNFAALIKED